MTGYWWDCGELTLLTQEQMITRLSAGLLLEIANAGPEYPTCKDLLHYAEV